LRTWARGGKWPPPRATLITPELTVFFSIFIFSKSPTGSDFVPHLQHPGSEDVGAYPDVSVLDVAKKPSPDVAKRLNRVCRIFTTHPFNLRLDSTVERDSVSDSIYFERYRDNTSGKDSER